MIYNSLMPSPVPTLDLSCSSVSSRSFSALHHAALTGTIELLSLLLEAQATVDIKDINGIMMAEQLCRLTQCHHADPQFRGERNPKCS